MEQPQRSETELISGVHPSSENTGAPTSFQQAWTEVNNYVNYATMEIPRLRGVLGSFESQLQTARLNLLHTSGANSDYAKEIDRLREDNRHLIIDFNNQRECNDELIEMNACINQANAELEKYKSKNGDYVGKYDALLDKQTKSLHDIIQLYKDIEQLEGKIKNLSVEKQDLKDAHSKVVEEKKRINDLGHKLIIAYKQLKEEHQVATTKKNDFKESLDNMEIEKEEFKQKWIRSVEFNKQVRYHTSKVAERWSLENQRVKKKLTIANNMIQAFKNVVANGKTRPKRLRRAPAKFIQSF